MKTGSTVIRKSLGRQLKALRILNGKSLADVGQTRIVSKTKLLDIEAGVRAIKISDVIALCRLYGGDEDTITRLSDMALNTNEKGWWEQFDDAMPSWFATYVELESASDGIVTYDPDLIHGLLQTPEYQRAVFQTNTRYSPAAADRQTELRTDRQHAAFDRSDPLQVTAVVGEGALSRKVGGEKVMAQQREHLVKLSAQGHIEVRVLTWDAGAHVAMKGAFTIINFVTPDAYDVVYLETYAGGRYVEEDQMIEEYRQMWQSIHQQSTPIEEYLT